MDKTLHTLTRVKKSFEQGSRPPTKGDVSGADHLILKAVLIDNTVDPDTIARFCDLLIAWSDQDLWLLCHCKRVALQDAPVLHPRIQVGEDSDSHSCTLVRTPGRGDHADGCFFSGERESRPHHGSVTGAPRTVSPGLGVLGPVRESGGTAVRGRITESQPRGPRIPTLARVLFTLLEAAKVNHRTPTLRSRLGEVGLISEQVGKKTMDGRNFSAAGWVRTSFGDLAALEMDLMEAWKPRESGNKNAKAWPSGTRPHGLLVDHVSHVEETPGGRIFLVTPDRHCIEVTGRLRRPGPGTCGPYLAIVLVSRSVDGHGAEVTQGYLHPVADEDSFLLVDSNLERGTFEVLVGLQQELWASGKVMTITKPLLDIKQRGLRPDFIIGGRLKPFVVETMGDMNDDYRTRKAGTHELMVQNIGAVVEDRPPHTDLRDKVIPLLGYGTRVQDAAPDEA